MCTFPFSYSHCRFFGSRYDTLSNLLGNDVNLTSSSPVVVQLTQLASSLAGVLLNVSGATYSDPSAPPTPSADPDTVAGLLECLLVQTNCSLLRRVLSPSWVDTLGQWNNNTCMMVYMYYITVTFCQWKICQFRYMYIVNNFLIYKKISTLYNYSLSPIIIPIINCNVIYCR